MKNLQFLALASIAALAMGSCSNESDLDSTYGDNTLRINATIGGMNTRASETDWDQDDKIGVSFGENENVPYTYSGTAFTAAEALKVNTAGDVTAYYPYDENLQDDVIDFDINSGKVMDFLFASASVTPDSPTADLQFAHKMSRLALTVVDGTDSDLASENSLGLKIANIATTGSFSTADGTVTPGNANGNYEFQSADFGEVATVIVPSYSAAANNPVQVIVTVGEKNFVGTITPALLAGNQYSYTLTIKGSTLESATLEITGGITGWTNNDGDGDLEEQYVLSVGDFLLKNGTTISPSKLTQDNKTDVVGVVYFVGNPQPSTLYPSVVTADKDILKAEASDATHGLAIAVKNANETAGRFSTSKDQIYTDWLNSSDPAYPSVGQIFIPSGWNTGNTTPTQLSGYNNTRIFQLAAEDKSYDMSILNNILSEYQNSNAVSNASNWYLPSYGEFSEIYKNYDVIVASLAKVDAELPAYDDTTDTSAPTAENFYWTSDFRNATNQFVSVLKPVSNIGRAILDKGSSNNKGWFRLSVAF